MYEQMLRIRMVEERIVALYPEQEMRCPTHLSIGQEAPPTGISAHLRTADLVFSGHRSHGHYIAKGGNLRRMLAELYGRVTGCARGKGGSQHLIDTECGFMGAAPILASTISVGVGAAWGAVMAGEKRVVVVYFGDGATEEGSFHEAMNFAGVKRLPVVFVCENNLYSVHSALDIRQPNRSIAELGRAHGVASAEGDGNDADVVSRLAAEAVARAKDGGGATIIELMTYRFLEHCGPNDDISLNYRTAEEVASWRARDPVETYRVRLVEEGVLGTQMDIAIRAKISAEIEDAVTFAKASPYPDVAELYEHVFPPVRAAV
jgi:TPP-dependent pyruvate/acetoin dehydrogenase alpha subunit